MRFRARHLACLLVLFSALGVAANAQAEPPVFRGRYIDVLLYRAAVEANAPCAAEAPRPLLPGEEPPDTTALPASASQLTLVWTMPMAAAHAAARVADTTIARI